MTSNPIEYREAQVTKQFYSDAAKLCIDGEVVKLSQLIESFREKNSQYSYDVILENFHSEGKTLVHIAAASGKINIMKLLLEKSIKPEHIVNLKDSSGVTPLINSTISESSETMQYLISKGADANHMNESGSAAAHFAAADGSVQRLEILWNAGALFNCKSRAGTPMHWAAGKRQLEAVRFLIKHGADVNVMNADNMTAALMAAAACSDEVVCALLAAGAELHGTVKDEATLLHVCAENGLSGAVAAILGSEKGRLLARASTVDGNLPIHYAAMSAQTQIITVLAPHSGPQFATLSVEDVLEIGRQRMREWQVRQDQASSTGGEVTGSASGTMTNKSNEHALAVEAPEPLTPAVDAAAIAAAEELKNVANTLYQSKQFQAALAKYSEAILLQGDNHVLWSNRSACFLTAGDAARALRDAEVCRRLKPDWPKGCYRLAAARLALGCFEDAAVAAFEGCKLDDSNADLKSILKKAVALGQQEHRAKLAQNS